MKRLIYWLIAACTASTFLSCLTDKKVAREAYARGICKTVKDSTHTKDSLAIRYRDSIRWHEAKQGEEINLVFGDNCDSLRSALEAIKKHPIVTKKNGITETVSSKDGKNLDFDCKEDSYADTLKNVRTERDFYHFEYDRVTQENKVECTKEHRTKFDGFTFWWFWISLVFVILYIASKRFLNGIH